MYPLHICHVKDKVLFSSWKVTVYPNHITKVHNNIKKLILNHTACITSVIQPAYPPFLYTKEWKH